MKNKTIFKRFGYLMENIGLNEMIDKYNLTDKISAGYSTFDPGVKNKSIVRKWKLWIPEIWKNKND
jgi:hypothetical protein